MKKLLYVLVLKVVGISCSKEVTNEHKNDNSYVDINTGDNGIIRQGGDKVYVNYGKIGSMTGNLTFTECKKIDRP